MHGLHARQIGSSGFLLWVHLKPFVYAAPVDNKETLHHHIVDAYQTIHNYGGIFQWIQQSMMRYVEACIASHVGHFERLLQTYSFSYNSEIRIWTFFLALV
jgi:hypothetical protein